MNLLKTVTPISIKTLALCSVVAVSTLSCSSQTDTQDTSVTEAKAPEVAVKTEAEAAPKSVRKNPGDRKGHVMKEVVPKDIIPPAPILTTEQALESFAIHSDFELEVVADSPIVYDPVFAIYDAKGRIWALEMTTYMQDTKATNEMTHDSQIVVLSDTNNDGTMDKRQVVIGEIILPRALAFVDKGIIWADNSSMYFSEIAENEDTIKVVKTELVDKTYAEKGNIEHKPNGLLYSLDNWYYSAKADMRYRPYPLNASLPKGAKEVYRNQYWKMARSKTEFRGQWGIAQDDYGRHYFLHNSTPLQVSPFLPNVAHRNPKQKFPAGLLKRKVGDNDVYPIRVNPGVNRGYLKGILNKEFKLAKNTSGGGPVVYRGNQYPAKYSNIGMVTESAGNLLRATKISDNAGVVSGSNLFDKQDILASTDERFRPVNLHNTPDGTILVVDFYHGIIQHRTFMTTYLEDQILSRDLQRSRHIGRLYRLKYKNNPLPQNALLNGLTATQLVPFLGHPNGWHRDTAQQLLVMQQDKSAVPALKALAVNTNNHLAQIKALWVLEGLGENSLSVLKDAATNSNDKVKRSVYRLADLLPTSQDLQDWLVEESKKVNKETADSLVLAAGTHKAWAATANIINTTGNSPFVIASLGNAEQAFLDSPYANIPTDVLVNIQAVGNVVKQVKQTLTPEVAKSFAKGKALYTGEAGCFGCHGIDGEGSSIVPPLNKSEWVTESPERLSAILLHGFSGPIKVRGKDYSGVMVMPGLATNPRFKDEDIADIATYIRNEWENAGSAVTASQVEKVRTGTQQQTLPYTSDSIKQLKVQ